MSPPKSEPQDRQQRWISKIARDHCAPQGRGGAGSAGPPRGVAGDVGGVDRPVLEAGRGHRPDQGCRRDEAAGVVSDLDQDPQGRRRVGVGARVLRGRHGRSLGPASPRFTEIVPWLSALRPTLMFQSQDQLSRRLPGRPRRSRWVGVQPARHRRSPAHPGSAQEPGASLTRSVDLLSRCPSQHTPGRQCRDGDGTGRRASGGVRGLHRERR